jgi:hypothetical protein
MRPHLLLLITLPSFAPAVEKIVFNRDIRPILSDKCFHCHGPDEKERKSGLRLDVRDAALKPAESGAIAIVPGTPKQSELIARCFTNDEEDLMPPSKMGKPLTDREKALLQAVGGRRSRVSGPLGLPITGQTGRLRLQCHRQPHHRPPCQGRPANLHPKRTVPR